LFIFNSLQHPFPHYTHSLRNMRTGTMASVFFLVFRT
jgi:hypothetical protein